MDGAILGIAAPLTDAIVAARNEDANANRTELAKLNARGHVAFDGFLVLLVRQSGFQFASHNPPPVNE